MTIFASTIRCRRCQKEHNSLLHPGTGEFAAPQACSNELASTSIASKNEETTQIVNIMTTTNGIELLEMTRVRLISNTEESVSIRTLLDFVLETSFVTKIVAQQLVLRRRKAHISNLQGIKIGKLRQAMLLIVGSEYSSKSVSLLTAFVLSNLNHV